MQSHFSPQRVSRDLQESPAQSPEDQNQRAEEVRVPPLRCIISRKDVLRVKRRGRQVSWLTLPLPHDLPCLLSSPASPVLFVEPNPWARWSLECEITRFTEYWRGLCPLFRDVDGYSHSNTGHVCAPRLFHVARPVWRGNHSLESVDCLKYQ